MFRGSTFYESSKGVTKVSEEYSKDVSISFKECLKDILWAFEESFKLSFKSFSRVLQLGTPRPQLVCIYKKLNQVEIFILIPFGFKLAAFDVSSERKVNHFQWIKFLYMPTFSYFNNDQFN